MPSLRRADGDVLPAPVRPRDDLDEMGDEIVRVLTAAREAAEDLVAQADRAAKDTVAEAERTAHDTIAHAERMAQDLVAQAEGFGALGGELDAVAGFEGGKVGGAHDCDYS